MKKQWRQILVAILGLFFSPILLATSFFNITTTDPIVQVLPEAVATITYVVQNNSGINVTGMKYFPPTSTTLSGGTCGTSLSNGASCTVTLSFLAPYGLGSIVLNPMKVCGINGHSQICSQSNSANQVTIIIIPGFAGYMITASAGANGSIAPSGTFAVISGTDESFTATPDSGYSVDQWFVDGVLVQTGGTSFTLTNIQANHTVEVTFVLLPTYTISASAGANGNVVPSGTFTVAQGADQPFTATPDSGYVIDQWFVDGISVQTGGTSYTLTNIQADHTVEVTFSLIPTYTITASSGPNGNISPSGSFVVTEGADQEFTATPNTNYAINQWLVDGIVVQTGGATYTLTNITANHTVQVTFSPTIGILTITVGSAPAMQYKLLNVVNNSSMSAQISSVDIAAGLTGRVKWCQSGDATCASGNRSTCLLNTNIVPTGSCTLWFQSLDAPNVPVSSTSGALNIQATDGAHPFTATYDMNLFVGGNFTSIDGVNMRFAGRWNGTTWTNLSFVTGSVGFNEVRSFAMQNGVLYAGGAFIQPFRVGFWDDSFGFWRFLDNNPTGTNDDVMAIIFYNNNLYVTGEFTQTILNLVFSPAAGIAQWTGTQWLTLSTGLSSGIQRGFALNTSYNGNLIVGGGFTSAGGVPASRIAQWDGANWSALDGGLSAQVNGLTVHNGNLVAGGSFLFADGISISVNRMAQWNGTTWSALAGPSGIGVNGTVHAVLAPTNSTINSVLAGGEFTSAGGIGADHVAQWNGSWAPLGGGLNNTVRGLAVQNNIVYAGGDFTAANAGGVTPVGRIAQWDGVTWSPVGSGVGANSAVFTIMPASSLRLQ